jgi:hypothetical protein
MIGILSGWGLGVAAMRAANAVRNKALLQSTLQQIEQRSVHLHDLHCYAISTFVVLHPTLLHVQIRLLRVQYSLLVYFTAISWTLSEVLQSDILYFCELI